MVGLISIIFMCGLEKYDEKGVGKKKDIFSVVD